MKEQLLFFVDPNINRELRQVVQEVAREAGLIYGMESVYADTCPDGYPSARFTVAGDTVADQECGIQRDANMILGEIERLLGQEGRHIVFIMFDDITGKSQGEYLPYCHGVTSENNIVISVRRFRDLPIIEQKVFLAGLIMRELKNVFAQE
ncbi:hypothetical protein J5491_03265 [Candidatus Saccharibacteria bacterium]|nr:hypothetical protein [Candidatus Saccharibacteria bacterium]